MDRALPNAFCFENVWIPFCINTGMLSYPRWIMKSFGHSKPKRHKGILHDLLHFVEHHSSKTPFRQTKGNTGPERTKAEQWTTGQRRDAFARPSRVVSGADTRPITRPSEHLCSVESRCPWDDPLTAARHTQLEVNKWGNEIHTRNYADTIWFAMCQVPAYL